MANKRYVRGRAFEQKLVNWLRDVGWPYVVRSAGSKGVADVVAIMGPKQVLLFQCKTGAKAISRDEVLALEKTALEIGAKAYVCTPAPKKWKGKFRFQIVIDSELRTVGELSQ